MKMAYSALLFVAVSLSLSTCLAEDPNYKYNIYAEIDKVKTNEERKDTGLPKKEGYKGWLSGKFPWGTNFGKGYEHGYQFWAKDNARAHIRLTESEIWLRMAAPGNFVGYGFHPDHVTMIGADIVVCGYSPAGKLGVTDYHGVEFGAPAIDKEQDWTLQSIGQTSGGWTWCEISRKREVCNDAEDFSIYDPDYAVSMFMAWGKSSNMKSPLGYHGMNRDGRTDSLGKIDAEIPVAPNEQQYTVRITAPPAAIPVVAGTEICSYHILSDVQADTPYHIVEVQQEYGKAGQHSACAQNDNPKSALICHHSTLISCPIIPEWEHLDGQLLPFGPGAVENCQQMWSKCNGDLVGGTIKTKNNEGIEMHGNRVVYLRHFYNPDLLEGLVDTGSYFELTYTPDLRPFIATRFFLQTTNLLVPKKTMNHKVGVLFPRECTQDMKPFKIVSASAHMHDRSSDAREIIVHHIRGGQELKPLLHVENFIERTESESSRPLSVDILPGDEIILECFYDNDSENDEVFGSSWWNQMCVVTFDVKSSGQMVYYNGNEGGVGDGKAYLGGDGDASFAQCGSKIFGEKNVYISGEERAKRFTYKPYVPSSTCENTPDDKKPSLDCEYPTKQLCKLHSKGHCVYKKGKCMRLCDFNTKKKWGCKFGKAKKAKCAWVDGKCDNVCSTAKSEMKCKKWRYKVKGKCTWDDGHCVPSVM